MTISLVTHCKRHPNVETALRCGKCGDPICPRCLVQTPVGVRCPTCANLTRLPTYNVSSTFYLRAIGAGIGIAVVAGLVWGIVQQIIPFFFIGLIIAGGVGYAIAEVIGLVVNRKRGTGLAIIGSLAVVLSFVVATAVFWNWRVGIFDVVSVIIGIAVAVNLLR